MGDFFNPAEEEWCYPESDYFLPMAAAMSNGQRAGFGYMSFGTMLATGTGTEEGLKSVEGEITSVFGEKTEFDIYEGVNREAFRGGVALTNEALMEQNAGKGQAFEEMYNNVSNMAMTSYALAAVGASSAVNVLFVLAAAGFTSGLGILAARYYGAGKWRELRKLLGSYSVILTLVMMLVMIFGRVLSARLLEAMDTPRDIFTEADDYLRILLIGAPFVILYNMYSAVLRGVGNSRMPFVCVAVSGVLNMLLDWVLVKMCGLGVAGAAWATVAAQALSAVAVILYTTFRYKELRFGLNGGIFDAVVMRAGLKLALPVAARSVISSFGSVLLQNFMNSFGSVTVAAISTSYRVDSMLLLPVMNLSVGISTMVSQSIGAENRSRAYKFFTHGMWLMLSVACALTIVICTFGGKLVALFGVGQEAVEIGRRFFIRLSLFYPMFAAMRAITGYLEGLGDVTFTGIITIASLAVRLGASYALKGVFGNMVLAWAEVISWVFMLAAMWLRYVYKRKNEIA
jgi:putative MATE family efflux protein